MNSSGNLALVPTLPNPADVDLGPLITQAQTEKDLQHVLETFWAATHPTEQSPYALYDYPPLWPTLEIGGATLFTGPCRTMGKPAPYAQFEPMDGLMYHFRKNEKWVGMGHTTTFAEFFQEIKRNHLQPKPI